jgi:tRNA A37 threonylcarbamoyladenosine modification protein TsaB
MLHLFLESSMPWIGVGLYDESKGWLGFKGTNEGRGEHLNSLACQLLQDHHLSFSDLTGVHVTTGPGSFTGIRVGLAFAQGLCFSGKVQLRTSHSFQSMQDCSAGPFACIFVYSKPDLYYGWNKTDEGFRPCLYTSQELLKALACNSGSVALCGPMPESLFTHGQITEFSQWNSCWMQGREVALKRETPLAEGMVIKPLYLQTPQFGKK